jgi:hypothetical protein
MEPTTEEEVLPMNYISELEIKNYKCFEHAVIPMAPLTLLSGKNGVGKTAAMEPLRLLRQTISNWEGVAVPHLNYLHMPMAGAVHVEDVLRKGADTPYMEFNLTWNSGDRLELQYMCASSSATCAPLVPRHCEFDPELVPFSDKFVWNSVPQQAMAEGTSGKFLFWSHPEAYRDASVQTEIGLWAARAAASGAQVVVETHSDHVLNGIRIAVMEGVLDRDNVSLLFLEEGGKMTAPQIDSDGRLDHWPAGFFDEWDNSLGKLLRGHFNE